jgi:hypothetical protein
MIMYNGKNRAKIAALARVLPHVHRAAEGNPWVKGQFSIGSVKENNSPNAR